MRYQNKKTPGRCLPFMRRAKKQSRRYRGARSGGIGVLIPVLIVLCIIAAGILYFVNDNMTFTLDGAFLSQNKDKTTANDVSANLIIETPDETDAVQPEDILPEPEAGTPASDETDGVHALFIPIGEVKSEELFAAKLSEIPADKKINTLILEVKAEDGTLAFSSESPLATAAAVSGDDGALSRVIQSAKEKGYRVSLYMSCFKDNEAARKSQDESARTKNKIIWLDNGNMRWLSAYSDKAREYLVSSIKKLSSLSPDEIILSNISFPAEGKTELLSYDEKAGTKEEMLQTFIADAKAAAGNIPLSAVYENYNDVCIKQSGQTPGLFSEFEHLYVANAATKFRNPADNARELFDEEKIIAMSPTPIGDEFVVKNR